MRPGIPRVRRESSTSGVSPIALIVEERTVSEVDIIPMISLCFDQLFGFFRKLAAFFGVQDSFADSVGLWGDF